MNKNPNDKLKAVKRFKLIRNLVIIALLIAAFFRFVIGFSKIDGYSMYPTLENDDIVVFSRLNRNIKFGDVVAIQLPSGAKYVKRVVAVGGDTVDIIDDVFYRNGEPLDDMPTLEEKGGVEFPLTVLPGEVFTLGDNRAESTDSRFYGPVNLQQIQGVLLIRVHNFKIAKVK